jgi:spermidine synthase
VLAVWSAGPDKGFVLRLRKVGFEVDELRVRARGSKGSHHVIWLGMRH